MKPFDATSNSEWRRSRAYGVLFVLLVIFVLGRVTPAYDVVFPENGRVELLGADSYFHIRHAQYATKHFPGLLRGDPGSHYPGVEYQAYSGLFNLSVAGASIVLQPLGDDARILAAVSAWSPVVLSALALLALYFLGAGVVGRLGGVLAALIFYLYPGYSLSRSVLGFGDQHAAELMLAALTLLGLVSCLKNSGARQYRPSLLRSLPFAAFFYTWIGAPMYVAFIAVSVFTVVIVSVAVSESSLNISHGLFRFFSGVAFWQVAVILFWPELELQLVANIHLLTLYAMVAMAIAPMIYFKIVDFFTARSVPGPALAIATLLLGVAAGYLFFTLHPRGQEFWFWLTNERAQNVAEQKIISWSAYGDLFGPAGWLALAALPLTLITPGSRNRTVLKAGISVFGLCTILIWMHTHDFDYVPPVFVALLAVLAIQDLSVWMRRGLNKLNSPGLDSYTASAGSFLLILILIAPVWPLNTAHTPWISTETVLGLLRHDEAWFDAMDWLRESTPSPSVTPITKLVKSAPYPDDVYGVMSTWDDGNFVSYQGRRLPTFSRYPSAGDALWLTAPSEEEANLFLCPDCQGGEHVRYAVLSYLMASHLFLSKVQAAGRTAAMQQEGIWNHEGKEVPRITFGDTFEKALVTRLFRDNGSGLEHYRIAYESGERQMVQTVYDPTIPELRYAADPLPPGVEGPKTGNHVLTRVGTRYIYDVHTVPSIRIYEIVPGAVLYGRISPGESLLLSLDLYSSSTGSQYGYSQTTTADSLGYFSFRVPYSTNSSTGSVVNPTSPYAVSRQSTGGTVSIEIDEMFIQTSDSIAVDFMQ
jgi:asparagine N-glycosylation enzyme membrane subunit Stt3